MYWMVYGLDKFGMILVQNMKGWLVIFIGMRLVCMIILCWLVRHDFWYGQHVIP